MQTRLNLKHYLIGSVRWHPSQSFEITEEIKQQEERKWSRLEHLVSQDQRAGTQGNPEI